MFSWLKNTIPNCFYVREVLSPQKYLSGSLCNCRSSASPPKTAQIAIYTQYKGPERLLILNTPFLQFLWWIALLASKERRTFLYFPPKNWPLTSGRKRHSCFLISLSVSQDLWHNMQLLRTFSYLLVIILFKICTLQILQSRRFLNDKWHPFEAPSIGRRHNLKRHIVRTRNLALRHSSLLFTPCGFQRNDKDLCTGIMLYIL